MFWTPGEAGGTSELFEVATWISDHVVIGHTSEMLQVRTSSLRGSLAQANPTRRRALHFMARAGEIVSKSSLLWAGAPTEFCLNFTGSETLERSNVLNLDLSLTQ